MLCGLRLSDLGGRAVDAVNRQCSWLCWKCPTGLVSGTWCYDVGVWQCYVRGGMDPCVEIANPQKLDALDLWYILLLNSPSSPFVSPSLRRRLGSTHTMLYMFSNLASTSLLARRRDLSV